MLEWAVVLEDSPKLWKGFDALALLLLMEVRADIPAVGGIVEATPVAINVLWGEYANDNIFEHVVE